MELIRYKGKDGQKMIRPASSEDVPMFKHYAGGLIAVSQKVFDDEFKWVMCFHEGPAYSITDLAN